MADFDIEAIRAQIRAMDFTRGTPAELVEWRMAHEDSRANLVARGIIPVSVPRFAEPQPFPAGGRFVAERPTRVGLVAMGYADGYPRVVPDGTAVAVEGRASRIIGRVSMDMLTIDLTELPDAGLGSRVELWGAQVPVNRIAQAAGTIAYELLCNVKRVGVEYVRR